MDLMNDLGLGKTDLVPTNYPMVGINRSTINIVGMEFVQLSGTGCDGTRTTAHQMVYISDQVP
jgi:hypothetical protein